MQTGIQGKKQAKDRIFELLRVKHVLTRMELYFDVVVSGRQVINGKPEPDIFLKAAAMLGCAPKDCYVFEDGINGAYAGIAAGCVTVMVPDLMQPTPDLRKKCTAICTDLLEVRDRIAGNEL